MLAFHTTWGQTLHSSGLCTSHPGTSSPANSCRCVMKARVPTPPPTTRQHSLFKFKVKRALSPGFRVSQSNVSCFQRWSYLGCNEWLFKLLLSFCHLKPVWLFSGLCYQQGTLAKENCHPWNFAGSYRTNYLFFHAGPLIRHWCVEKVLNYGLYLLQSTVQMIAWRKFVFLEV